MINPSYIGGIGRRVWSKAIPGQKQRPYTKITNVKRRDGGMAQGLGTCPANPSATKK
jgi:hypothetical protein